MNNKARLEASWETTRNKACSKLTSNQNMNIQYSSPSINATNTYTGETYTGNKAGSRLTWNQTMNIQLSSPSINATNTYTGEPTQTTHSNPTAQRPAQRSDMHMAGTETHPFLVLSVLWSHAEGLIFFLTLTEDQNRVLLFQRIDMVSGLLYKIAKMALDFRK